MWKGQCGLLVKPTLGKRIGAHLEDQEQRIQFGEAVEVDSIHTINALCLRFSIEAKPSSVRERAQQVHGFW